MPPTGVEPVRPSRQPSIIIYNERRKEGVISKQRVQIAQSRPQYHNNRGLHAFPP